MWARPLILSEFMMLDLPGLLCRGLVALCVATGVVLPVSAASSTCEGAQRISMRFPVELSEQELAEFRALPPLRVQSVDGPPLMRYVESLRTYTGIGPDIFCFIANQLGLRYELIPGRDQTVGEKIRHVQDGRADVFMSLSYTPERSERGIFTTSYYDSYYAVIAREGRRMAIHSAADLAHYRVGAVGGGAFESVLREIVPEGQLVIFDHLLTSDALFRALQKNELDVVVFNKDIFAEKRYQHRLFDLEVIYTLREYPRAYRFYFTPSSTHQRIVTAFDRYLSVIDISASIAEHEGGERHLIESYVAQRSQRLLLQAATIAALLLAMVFYLVLHRYRRLSRRLADGNEKILQQKDALQRANQKLETLSQTDGLTGLANRGHFDLVLEREMARQRRTNLPLSLLVLDVDHFKRVNDLYGHVVGDRYLQAISGVLRDSVGRSTDLAARYGGEEFVCLLPDTSAKDAYQVANRIRRGIDALGLPNPNADTPRLTLSIGIATVESGDFSAQTLVSEADAQLYAAKGAGRNRVHAIVLSEDV